MEIQRGQILVQRYFDIADEVDLKKAELLGAGISRRARFGGSAKTITLANPPLELVLAYNSPTFLDTLGTTELIARIYDVGALVLTYSIALPNNCNRDQLIAMAQRIADSDETITAISRPYVDSLRQQLASALKPGGNLNLVEDYTIFFLQQITPVEQAEQYIEQLDVPRLLAGDTGNLSKQERKQLADTAFSYRSDDLVVIDWNSALIVEPSGVGDVAEILELATMQMLELRIYDDLIGSALDRVYRQLDVDPSAFFPARHYRKISRQVMQLFMDVSEISERIDNCFSFIGDNYLARIYRSAVEEFGIPHWQAQLKNRLQMLQRINEVTVDHLTSQKSFGIEVMIMLLILGEITLAFYRH